MDGFFSYVLTGSEWTSRVKESDRMFSFGCRSSGSKHLYPLSHLPAVEFPMCEVQKEQDLVSVKLSFLLSLNLGEKSQKKKW